MTREYYIRTASGKKFDYARGGENIVDVFDVAYHLSHIPRFCGACSPFISVAQHSVHVSLLIERRGGSYELALRGLLHDAHEAFFGDIPTPALDYFFDMTGRDFKEVIVPGIDDAIVRMADLKPIKPAEESLIKECDMIALNAEGSRTIKGWINVPNVPTDSTLVVTPMTPEASQRSFMERYMKLKAMRNKIRTPVNV